MLSHFNNFHFSTTQQFLKVKQEKYLQIFNYLLEFSKLRAKPIRNIDIDTKNYIEKIWFGDLPTHLDSVSLNDNIGLSDDYWIKVSKPLTAPVAPSFPCKDKQLLSWIDLDSSGKNELKLLESNIIDGLLTPISSHPEIIETFNNYVKNEWENEKEDYLNLLDIYNSSLEIYNAKNSVYRKFFALQNKASQFEDEFELLFCAGLLNFQEDNDHSNIFRHLFVQKAEIEFLDTKSETCIIVSPSKQNDISIELDSILDVLDPELLVSAKKSAEDFITKSENSIELCNSSCFDLISSFSNKFHSDGSFIENFEKPSQKPTSPTVFFSPTLILRKRNTKSLTNLYENIITDITISGDEINIPQLNDIVYKIDELESGDLEPGEREGSILNDNILYFPLKYNDEQEEIVSRLGKNRKVLVQGPPGTGKSHTITNLICHLLSKGNKVLVTAQSKRALEVLKDKMPEEFQNLSVSLLSGDSASVKEVNGNVQAINEKLSSLNIIATRQKIEILEKEYHELQRQNSLNKNSWVIKRSASVSKSEISEKYIGTELEIAEKLEKEQFDYDWFIDPLPSNFEEAIEFIPYISNLFELSQVFDSTKLAILNSPIPILDKILSLSEFDQLATLNEAFNLNYHSNVEEYELKNLEVDSDKIPSILDELTRLKTKISIIENSKYFDEDLSSLKRKIIDLGRKITDSQNLLSQYNFNDLKKFQRENDILIPSNISLVALKSNLNEVLRYVESGNSVSSFLFKIKNKIGNSNIKRAYQFILTTSVNGSICDSKEKLNFAIDYINYKQDFKELGALWDLNLDSSLHTQFEYFERLTSELSAFIFEVEEIESSIKVIIQNSNIEFDILRSDSIDSSLQEFQKNAIKIQFNELVPKRDSTLQYLKEFENSSIAIELLDAINSLDFQLYENKVKELEEFYLEKGKLSEFEDLRLSLAPVFPILIVDIISGKIGTNEIANLSDAFKFRNAQRELSDLIISNNQITEERSIEQNEEKIGKLISQLASTKAWLKIVENLTANESLKKDLQAWVMAMGKIGKTGTSKTALKFKKEAQVLMEKCQKSIPCWIMPLYKVAETVYPQRDMYDYVIIDEASQLGPDALFLLYISKRIIIVGDDKQTSPEYVGVNADIMTPHINQHLSDIPYKEFYGTEFSFFDHASIFCDGLIVLREHFRCMPEIIEFSNKHFYAPENKGLYPLKQFSENRLDPLINIYCPDGYSNGKGSNITNPVEANLIAEKIKEIVANPKYANKTIGVISLQGNSQSQLIEHKTLNLINEIEFRNRKIICGNSASFQGDERDVILLSLITCVNHNRTSLTKAEDQRRYNVAVSRAKEQIILFHSVQLEELKPQDLRFMLLDHFVNYSPSKIALSDVIKRVKGNQPMPFDSWFEVDVYNDIVSKGFSVIPQYEVVKGRYRIDLVVLLPSGVKIAIECDGDKFHGPEEFQSDLNRQKTLERCGWQFFRVRGSEYYSNRIEAMKDLWPILEHSID